MAEQNQEPIHVNVFLKGIIQDIDINEIPPDKYFMGEDIKLMDKEGQGYVLTNVDGNEYAFILTVNFIPLGYVEHKDVMYIISCARNGLGEGEVGTFPSINPDTGKWELLYRPLRNYSDDRVGKTITNVFRTDLFNVVPSNRVEIIAKDHYDGSVNLYFADGRNQLRTVNSGFAQAGVETFELADPPYTNDNFETKVNLILGSRTSSKITLSSITTGGNLKYGNYIFYIKYTTESFDETYFVAESDTVPIFKGINTVGSIRGGSASDRSDKKVSLLIENVDQSYKYIRIGYIRHFSDYNGVVTYQFGEINNRYEVDKINPSMIVDIIGTEGEVFLTEEEILLKKDTEIIPESITQLANRMWGANWKKVQTHNQSLTDFAKLIKIGYETLTVDDLNVHQALNDVFSQYYDYRKYDTVGYFRGEVYPFGIIAELNDGSFTESYPLNGVDMWNDLTPEYNPEIGGNANNANFDGVFRFPSTKLCSTIPANYQVDLLGVKFDMEDAWMSIMAANDNNWIRFNVRAIYFVRGERYKNMKYQGLMMSASAPFLENGAYYNLTKYSSLADQEIQYQQTDTTNYPGYDYFQRGYNFASYSYLTSRTSYHPLWGHRIAGSYEWDIRLDSPHKFGPVYRGYAAAYYQYSISGNRYDRSYTTRFFNLPDKYCFYSVDMLLNAFNDISDINWVWRVGKTIAARPLATTNNVGIWDHNGGWDSVTNQVSPAITRASMAGAFISNTERLSVIQNKVMVGESGIVKPADNGYFDFINGAEEPFTNQNQTWFMTGSTVLESSAQNRLYNRSMLMAKYLGIDFNNIDATVGGTLNDDDMNLDIVSLYSIDPNSININNIFPNLNAIQYKKISHPVLISDVVAGIIANNWNSFKTQTCWKGDCFLQKTHFKQMYWAGSSSDYYYFPSDTEWDKTSKTDEKVSSVNSVKIANGLVIGIVTENAHNSAMRSVDGTNSFFPATDIVEFSIQAYNVQNAESFKLNYGYDQTLSNNIFLSYDPALPDKELQYMTRIKYSDPTIPGSYIDSYRSFRIKNYVDFDTNLGPIKRIATVFDKLISIQENAIIEHYINERVTQSGIEGQSAVLGYGDILSPNFRNMSNFGTQHKWSVVQADTIYGIDWKNRVVWEVGLQRSSSGGLFLDARDISKEAFIEKWMRETALVISNNRSDKFNNYNDDTMNGEGIVAGYDKNTKDVYFIFHKKTEVI